MTIWAAQGGEEKYWCDTCKCYRFGPHFCPGEYDPETETKPKETEDEIQST